MKKPLTSFHIAVDHCSTQKANMVYEVEVKKINKLAHL